MLELRMAKGRILKTMLQAMKHHVTDANFNFSATGLSLYEPDTTGRARVSLCLPSNCFKSYRCDRNFATRMNINNMLKMFAFAGDNNSLTLKVDDGGEFVTFIFDDDGLFRTRTADLEMRPMSVDFKYDAIGEIDYDTIVRMPSRDFARICSNLSEIGDTVEISVSKKDCVQFSSTGDIGSGSINRHQNTKACWPEEATEIEMKKPISLTLDARYLKFNPLGLSWSREVIISMSSCLHLLVEYKVLESGYLRFYFPTKEMEAEMLKEILLCL